MQKNSKAFRTTRVLTAAAMLTAISVLIGIVCKNFFTYGIYYRVTFENLPVIMAGMLFGPVVGGAVGAAADIVSCLCSANPAVIPGITVGAAAVGVVAGAVPRTLVKKRGDAQTAVSVALAHLVGQVAIKSAAKIVWLGMPWYGVFIGLGVSLFVGTLEFFALRLLLRNKAVAAMAGGESHDL